MSRSADSVAGVATANPVIAAIVVLSAGLIVRFAINLHFYRTLVRGLPGPPHHPLWGHLPVIVDLLKTLPLRTHPQCYARFIQEKYGLGDFFYLDAWPFSYVLLMIVDPDITYQITVKSSLPKHKAVKDFMKLLVDSHVNLVSSDGIEWSTWRRSFNPGFSVSHLMTHIPGIVEDSLVFCDILHEHARKGDVFRLEEAATRLTIDIIARVILDTRLNSQTSDNELANAIQSQVQWIPQGSPSAPWDAYNPWALVVLWWNTRKMTNYLSKVLDQRDTTGANRSKRKHVIDFVLETSLGGKRPNTSTTTAKGIDSTFKKHVISQVKTLLFAGHDTVSGTICYALHLLSKDAEWLAKVRKEHDQVFGPDLDNAPQLIKSNGHLLQKLEYTLAVIKEVLRLYPPASSVRAGEKNFFIRDPKTGTCWPTEHCMLLPVDVGLHRHPSHFPDPHAFRPDRFLSKESHPAYVPFSKGPRTCIGQELAVIEVKIILVLVLRRFDIRAAYEDLALLKGDGSCWPNDTGGIQEVWGEEAYQVMQGSAKPREGMPARVSLRTR
ncbi:MAG: hypothetical protein Q9187_000381 [Circinaria calcarea]